MHARARDLISLLLMALGVLSALAGIIGLAFAGHWTLAGALAGPYVIAAGIALGYHETHLKRGAGVLTEAEADPTRTPRD